ncbi:MAG: PAS domain-containing protein [Myxococcota bacterium]
MDRARESDPIPAARVSPGQRALASWLVAERPRIEKVMSGRLGPAAPGAGDSESEALRRFRSFTASALLRGQAPAPALDGVRANERRVMALLHAWTEAAEHVAAERGGEVRRALAPLVDQFRLALRKTQSSRRSKGAPRSNRRAVTAAIDRVADAFLAVDTESAEILDANPAAGALLAVERDALLGLEVMRFVAEEDRSGWWTELDSVAEGAEPRAFVARMRDAGGDSLRIHASVTRFQTRGRTLALIVARTLAAGAARDERPFPEASPSAGWAPV